MRKKKNQTKYFIPGLFLTRLQAIFLQLQQLHSKLSALYLWRYRAAAAELRQGSIWAGYSWHEAPSIAGGLQCELEELSA